MENVEHMSKYARKKAERRAAKDHALAAIDFAIRLTEGKVAVKAKKPKQPPPEPRGALACLGTLPVECAACLRNAAGLLRTALELAYKMQELAKKGRQAGEAYALVGIIAQIPDRVEYAATRCNAIPNTRSKADDVD